MERNGATRDLESFLVGRATAGVAGADALGVSAPPLAPVGRPDPARPTAAKRPVLLVVDDEPEVLRSVHDLFRMRYEVVTRNSGPAALEYLRTAGEVHVVLTDQRMPGMTGVELLAQAQALRPETTRLLFTAYSDLVAVVDAINRGHVFRYIAKPWDPEELEVVLRQAVEHHDLIVEKNRLVEQLRAANAKLEEANRLKGAFLEVASHELNTPVTVVLGLMEIWRMTQGPTARPNEREWAGRLHAAARRLARTVERMFKLVRHEEFAQHLAVEPVDLEALVRGVAEELGPYLEIRRQTVEIAVAPALGPFEADRSKLTDILINLLANAIKFTPDGGTIRVDAADDPRAPGRIRVEVRDEGIGVHPAEQKHLFEPFFTGFDTMHHSSGDYEFCKRGIGLGLCLVKSFVELHGGTVDFRSTPEKGSTFAFTLPRRQPDRPGVSREAADDGTASVLSREPEAAEAAR